MREYGYSEHQLPQITNKYGDRNLGLIVCGDAACVWDDLERFGARSNAGCGSVIKSGFHLMTVNKIVEVLPGNIEHAYSNDPVSLTKFVAARRQEYTREFDGPRHSHSCNAGAKWHWPFGGHATSALSATLAGIGMGYAPIVLCGIPLDNGPHNGEPHWRKCAFTAEAADSADGMNRHWKRANELAFKGKVKSMSGRTKQWLGSP